MTRATDKATEVSENTQNNGAGGLSGADYQTALSLNSFDAAKATAAQEFGRVEIAGDNGQTCAS